MQRRHLTLIALGLSGMATATMADPGDPWSRGFDNMMWGTGYGMIGGFMMLLFWGVLIVLIVMAVRWFGNSGGPTGGGKLNAQDILKERFARGEIDEDEFKKRKAALDG